MEVLQDLLNYSVMEECKDARVSGLVLGLACKVRKLAIVQDLRALVSRMFCTRDCDPNLETEFSSKGLLVSMLYVPWGQMRFYFKGTLRNENIHPVWVLGPLRLNVHSTATSRASGNWEQWRVGKELFSCRWGV